MIPYNDSLNAADQIDAEENVAAIIFDHPEVECGEHTATKLGRTIVYAVLRRFRPDLFEEGADGQAET